VVAQPRRVPPSPPSTRPASRWSRNGTERIRQRRILPGGTVAPFAIRRPDTPSDSRAWQSQPCDLIKMVRT